MTRRGHGGRRPGAGRPPRGSAPGRKVSVLLSPEDEAELTAALFDGETLSELLRDGAIERARRRGPGR